MLNLLYTFIYWLYTLKDTFPTICCLSVLHLLNRVMPSNVEIKARVRDPVWFAERAADLSQSEGTIIRQHDTFFNCSQGRLKLRDFMVQCGCVCAYALDPAR